MTDFAAAGHAGGPIGVNLALDRAALPLDGLPAGAELALRAPDLLGAARRRPVTLAVTALAVLALVLGAALQVGPRYTATSLVLVEAREAQLLGVGQDGGLPVPPASQVETEAEIAHAAGVLDRVVAAESLDRDPDYQPRPSPWARLAAALGLPSGPAPSLDGTLADRQARTAMIDALSDTISVSRRGLTNLFAISATASTPGKAASLADAVAAAYLDEEADVRASLAQDAAHSLRVQADRLSLSLHEAKQTMARSAPGTPADLYGMQRETQAARDLYDATLARLHGLEQQAELHVPAGRLVARAGVPGEPSFPSLRMLLGCALPLSLVAGLGLAVLRDRAATGFTSVAETEQRTMVPLVAVLPFRDQARHGVPLGQVLSRDPLSSYAEAVRRARLGLEALAGQAGLTVAVTSTTAREGRTSTAVALAEAFALAGRRTILIDADLRGPGVADAIGAGPLKAGQARAGGRGGRYGLLDFLTARPSAGARGFIVRWPDCDRLDVAFGSVASPVATDGLIGSDRFAALMRFARERYEVVVIDTPPVDSVLDGRLIARHADVALHVVRWAHTSQLDVLLGLRELALVPGLRVVTLLNGSRERAGARPRAASRPGRR